MAGTEAAVAADVQVAPVGVPQSQHDTSVRAFLKVTSVRQAVLLFLGSLLYDIGSIACVPCLSPVPRRTPAADSAVRSPCNPVPRYLIELFAGAVCFIIASASFVFSVALDLKHMEEQNEEVCVLRRELEPSGSRSLVRLSAASLTWRPC